MHVHAAAFGGILGHDRRRFACMSVRRRARREFLRRVIAISACRIRWSVCLYASLFADVPLICHALFSVTVFSFISRFSSTASRSSACSASFSCAACCSTVRLKQVIRHPKPCLDASSVDGGFTLAAAGSKMNDVTTQIAHNIFSRQAIDRHTKQNHLNNKESH